MESQDSLHGSSEEEREEEKQTKGERVRKSVMKMKAGVKRGGRKMKITTLPWE